MGTLSASIDEDLYHLLGKHGNDRLERELLAFWGRHPDANFSRRVICYALECSKLEAESVLNGMVEEGLLDKHDTCGVTLYSLTRNEEKRRPIKELAALSWDQRRLALKQIENENK